MKLFFRSVRKIFTLSVFLSQVQARDIILITYREHLEKAKRIEEILKNEIRLPAVLIDRRWHTSPCEKNEETIVHICLADSGEMEIPFYDSQILQESFPIFFQEAP